MMSADQILAAYATRQPASYKHDIAVRPEPKPWWQCDTAPGGDIRNNLKIKETK